jgi:nucleoside 2-deoxyribosyltransferase
MVNKRVYLAGPIFGKNDAECTGWRMAAIAWLNIKGFVPVDPMVRDYRGREDFNAEDIVGWDKDDIESCGTVLANVNEPSWGTAMELMYAMSFGKRVVAFATHSKCRRISPWVRCHTHAIYESLQRALGGITEGSTEGLRI